MRTTYLLSLTVAACAGLGACANAPVVPPASVGANRCVLIPAPKGVADTVVVALFDAVEPAYAPWGHNRSEQIVFHHLYETLVTMDCSGEIRLGLARSWVRENRGKLWRFELRDDARFWDGSDVRAADVVGCWGDALSLDTVVDSVAAADDGSLEVFLREEREEVPGVLSLPAFSVTKATEGEGYPLGTGPYRPDPRGKAGTLDARALWDSHAPVLRFKAMEQRDERDLVDNVDIMVSDDPSVIDYASELPDLVTQPLPWSRSYVLLSRSRVSAMRAGTGVGDVSAAFQEGFARDAVRVDARACPQPHWWSQYQGCVTTPTANLAAVADSARRILFDEGDPVARSLAERIVALGAADPGALATADEIRRAVPGLRGEPLPVTAEGVAAHEFERSLRGGLDFAYIVALPRRPLDPCAETRDLARRAPWLAAVEIGDAIIPLVDTRPHVIARSGRCGILVDGLGNIFVTGNTAGLGPIP